jgi:hypothetical protein
MIRLTRESLKFLLAGQSVPLEVDRQYKRGGIYSVGVARKMICQAQVIACEEQGSHWRITVKRLSGDEARLFTHSGGTVKAPVEANPDDPDVLRGADFYEPEPLTDAQVRDLNYYRATSHRARITKNLDPTENVLATLDEMLSAGAMSGKARDHLRAARHHVRKASER